MSNFRRKNKKMKNIEEKNETKNKIIELVEKINNQDILNYIYIIVSDIAKEDRADDKRRKENM